MPGCIMDPYMMPFSFPMATAESLSPLFQYTDTSYFGWCKWPSPLSLGLNQQHWTPRGAVSYNIIITYPYHKILCIIQFCTYFPSKANYNNYSVTRCLYIHVQWPYGWACLYGVLWISLQLISITVLINFVSIALTVVRPRPLPPACNQL